ncbi:site-2 protease family protein [Conexibacter woesei]|uniref:site-2 protease family protein n=1 Tax=Conexibacter woesei TaxID=191495 RepID=UPI000478EA15|nr:site-2 protease family protein [Conexibacter woesei]
MFRSGGSTQLARVFGIRIGASPGWFIFLFLMIWWLSARFTDELPGASDTTTYATAVAGAVLFFLSIALHELGHAVVARRNGIEVLGIDLWVFGGLAKLSRDSESPGEEFRIAAAGPFVTLVLTVIGVVAVAIFSHANLGDNLAGDVVDSSPGLALAAWLALVNFGLLVFNLVPGFPLDGGRIARSIAWKITGDRNRATRFAGRLGQGFSYILIGFGVYLLATGDAADGLWLGILGWFLSQGASSAVVSSQFAERIEGVTAGDLMDNDPVAVPRDTTALAAQDEFFLRYRLPWFPVIDTAGLLVGLLRQDMVESAVAGGHPALRADELLKTGEGDLVSVARDAPLESLLASEPLRSFGALAVVDAEGRLCGLLTLDRVRRALAASV